MIIEALNPQYLICPSTHLPRSRSQRSMLVILTLSLGINPPIHPEPLVAAGPQTHCEVLESKIQLRQVCARDSEGFLQRRPRLLWLVRAFER